MRRWNAFHAVQAFHQDVDSDLADIASTAEPSRRDGVEYVVDDVLSDRWAFRLTSRQTAPPLQKGR